MDRSVGKEDDADQEPASHYYRGGYHVVYVGDVLDERYLVLRKMGWNELATSWLARDEQSQRYVTLTIFKSSAPYMDHAVGLIRTFIKLQEQPSERILQLLDHFIVTGVNGMHIGIVTEVMAECLYNYMIRLNFQPTPMEESRRILKQILEGVHHLHTKNKMVHTNIKPDTIFFKASKSYVLSILYGVYRTYQHSRGGSLPAFFVCNLPNRLGHLKADTNYIEAGRLLEDAEFVDFVKNKHSPTDCLLATLTSTLTINPAQLEHLVNNWMVVSRSATTEKEMNPADKRKAAQAKEITSLIGTISRYVTYKLTGNPCTHRLFTTRPRSPSSGSQYKSTHHEGTSNTCYQPQVASSSLGSGRQGTPADSVTFIKRVSPSYGQDEKSRINVSGIIEEDDLASTDAIEVESNATMGGKDSTSTDSSELVERARVEMRDRVFETDENDSSSPSMKDTLENMETKAVAKVEYGLMNSNMKRVVGNDEEDAGACDADEKKTISKSSSSDKDEQKGCSSKETKGDMEVYLAKSIIERWYQLQQQVQKKPKRYAQLQTVREENSLDTDYEWDTDTEDNEGTDGNEENEETEGESEGSECAIDAASTDFETDEDIEADSDTSDEDVDRKQLGNGSLSRWRNTLHLNINNDLGTENKTDDDKIEETLIQEVHRDNNDEDKERVKEPNTADEAQNNQDIKPAQDNEECETTDAADTKSNCSEASTEDAKSDQFYDTKSLSTSAESEGSERRKEACDCSRCQPKSRSAISGDNASSFSTTTSTQDSYSEFFLKYCKHNTLCTEYAKYMKARKCSFDEVGSNQDDNFEIVIGDLANVCSDTDNTINRDDVQRQYRAVELLYKNEFDSKIDIWSVACIAFELITGDFLFNPNETRMCHIEEHHLMKAIQLMAEIPPDLMTQDRLIHNIKPALEREALAITSPDVRSNFYRLLRRTYHFSSATAKSLSSVLVPMLQLDPLQRATAAQVLENDWFK